MEWAALVAQMVKNPPAMQETWVSSVGWEEPLEEGMASHSSILAWRISWTEGSTSNQKPFDHFICAQSCEQYKEGCEKQGHCFSIIKVPAI